MNTYATIYQEIKTQKPTRSEIFSAWNTFRRLASRGIWEVKRLNRALGILISQSITGAHGVENDYVVTRSSCDCPDHQYRGQTCKHIIAFHILEKIDNNRQPSEEESAAERALRELGY